MKLRYIAIAITAFILLALAIKGYSILAAILAPSAGAVLVWSNRRTEREIAKAEAEKRKQLHRVRELTPEELKQELLRSAREGNDE